MLSVDQQRVLRKFKMHLSIQVDALFPIFHSSIRDTDMESWYPQTYIAGQRLETSFPRDTQDAEHSVAGQEGNLEDLDATNGLDVTPGPFRNGLGFRFLFTNGHDPQFYSNAPEDLSIHVHQQDIQCFKLAEEAMDQHEKFSQPALRFSPADDVGMNHPVIKDKYNFVEPRIGNLPRTIFLDAREAIPRDFLTAFAIMTVPYAGLHLLPWNGPLHTAKELLLWRISAATIASALPLLVAWRAARFLYTMDTASLDSLPKWLRVGVVPVFSLATRILKWMVGVLDGESQNGLGDVVIRTGFIITLFPLMHAQVFFLPLYFFSRVFLIVEPFLNLPYVPESVLVLPQWASYFPHIS